MMLDIIFVSYLMIEFLADKFKDGSEQEFETIFA